MRGWHVWGDRLQRVSLCILFVFLPFSPAAIEITFFLLLAGWVLEHAGVAGWRRSYWAERSSRGLLLPLVGYVGICAFSIATSTYPDKSLHGFIGKTLEYALLFLIVTDVARKPNVVRRALICLFVSSAVVVLDAIAQELLRREPIRGHELHVFGRMTGPYTNPIDLGTYAMVVIPIALGWMSGRRSARGRAFLGVLTLGLLGCLVRTESQSAWLGFMTALVVFWFFHPSLRAWWLGLSAGFLVSAGALLVAMNRVGELITSNRGVTDRIFMWTSAWRMIMTHPFIGVGLNTFMANYLAFWVGGEQQPRYAHNCYLQAWAETGLVGLGLFLWLLWSVFSWLIRGVRHATGNDRMILIGLTAGLLAFAVQASFDTNFYSLRQATLFWTLAGLAVGCGAAVTSTR